MPVDAEAAKAIFMAALDKIEPTERAAFLAEACGSDDALRLRVEVLLKAHDDPGSFMKVPNGDLLATVDEPVTGGPGTLIGPYKLLEQIGEGGFGVVFMAEQTRPVRRKVALKVLKPGMDSKQVVARFEAERQALALMDHPNIARVLDAGQTDSGRPYFVMELVKGLPITDYCDQNQFTPQQRLELFVSVCQAVQHAHQKGVIHRDLKPSNVLVTLQDGAPLVKVIDFGIAKALGQQLTDKTLFTGFAQLVGTPLYMSPEQAALSNADVDTRSDIYSLGVLLYELLTGTTPFDKKRLKEVGYDELRRIVREEEAPRPSTRLSTLGKAATAVCENRRCDPKQLRVLLRCELDWVVMRALEKDRNRRYETALELADDIRRYLHNDPVLACPPTMRYRFRKLLRKHRGLIAAAATVLAVLLAVTLVTALAAVRLREQLVETQNARDTAEANLDLAHRAVDEMYTRVAKDMGGQWHLYPFQRDILEKSLPFYQEIARRRSNDPVARRETASARLRVANILYTFRHNRQAKKSCEEAIAALEELAAELPTDVERRSWLGNAYYVHGCILVSLGRTRDAEKSYRQALALHRDLAAEDPDNPRHRFNLAASHLALGTRLFDHPREAEQALRTGVKLYEELAAGQRGQRRYEPELSQSFFTLGQFYYALGQYGEAEVATRRAMDILDKSTEWLDPAQGRWLRLAAEFQLGRIRERRGKWEEAEKTYRHALEGMERFVDVISNLPQLRATLAGAAGDLAAFLARRGKREETASLVRRARELYEKLQYGFADDWELLQFLDDAGHCLRDAGDLETAEQYLRKELTLAGKLAQERPDEPTYRKLLARCHAGLATALQRRGRVRAAAEQYRLSLAIQEQLAKEFPEEPSYRHAQASALNFVGIALRNLPDERAKALECHQRAISICEQLVAEYPDQPQYRGQLVRGHFGLGIVLRLAERPAEAGQAFQRALDAYRPYSKTYDDAENREQFASVHNEWAWMLATWPDMKYRDPGRAAALARKAVELAPEKAEFLNTLGVAEYRVGNWKEAITALKKSEEAAPGKYSGFNAFILAMAHWQLGDKEQARTEYQQGVESMEKKQPKNEELRRFRAEAEELFPKN